MTYFSKMPQADQDHWLETMKSLELEKFDFSDNVIYLNIPVGQEKLFVNALNSDPLIDYAELDCDKHVRLD